MKTPFYLCVSLLITFMITSCEKDQSNLSVDGSIPIQPRTVTTPGSFSTTSGILNFPTVADFHQTADYIATDTVRTQLTAFRASFALKTINKQAKIILDSLENILHYPSKVVTNWPSYNKYVDLIIDSGDTAVVSKFGVWGEFLNKDNLVIIDGYLYKITPEKTIIIIDGDVGKLDDAEELEESDTTAGIYLTLRACAPCDATGYEWHEEQTVQKTYNNKRYRSISQEVYSNLTIWKKVAGQNHRVIYPKFSHRTDIKFQKHGIAWWEGHRIHFNWNAQVWVTHNLLLPTGCPNCNAYNTWYESVGWNNQYEYDFHREGSYTYPSYNSTYTWDMPGGYCLQVKIFSQNATTTDNPMFSNFWYHYPNPNFDCSDLTIPFEHSCPNFNWMFIY